MRFGARTGAVPSVLWLTPRVCAVRAAYEALSNPEKRKIYDRYGEDGLKQHAAGQQQGQPQDIFSQCVQPPRL